MSLWFQPIIIFVGFLLILFLIWIGSKCIQFLPVFHGEKWNEQDQVREYNNCYAYAFRDWKQNRHKKPQPGEMSQLAPLSPAEFTCENMLRYVTYDNPNVLLLNPPHSDVPCPCGY